ncbi:biotin transporter BioY [Evansella sp. AB-P1]|uniref:biotin transporter BioY n=1 Tax=Evansella sp. AB-P1 TaxID=3037653 RepID=UPI00241C21E0|nr:biotin transporter BioY [Evansella sp. AB-P1]MDG5790192.1 biotin transporter BioY [Evansella sp. AB-P1]
MNTENTSKRVFKVIDLTKAAMFIALMAIGANLTAFIMIGVVPLTFQTVIAILAGVLLGKKIGTLSMTGYALVGLLGAPVFSRFQGGLHMVLNPTFGFILSFILLAFVVGWIIEKSRETNGLSISTYFIACYIGLFINYVIGIFYMYFHAQYIIEATNVTLLVTATSMTPFFIKDVIITGMAATLCPKIVKALNLSGGHIKNNTERPA